MAFFRRRPTGAPGEDHSHPGAEERERADWSVVKILAVLVGFIAFGLWYYVKDREMVSSDGTVVRTTGPAVPRDANENRAVAQPDSNENRPSPLRVPAPQPQRAPAPPPQQ